MTLKYYEEENARHPVLHAAKCMPVEAEEAIRRLWLHFAGRSVLKVLTNWARTHSEPPKYQQWPLVTFTSGNRHSNANLRRVVLNKDCLSWLLVIHELAHSLDAWKEKTGGRSSAHRWHSKHHARWVDKLAAYITELGWPAGELAHELALKEEVQRERRAMAAKPPDRSARIAHKTALVERLERKVKALQSRIKSHKRSISALERAERKAK